MQSSELLEELKEISQSLLSRGEAMLEMDKAQLNARPRPDAWSALECLEHLNRYGDHYLPALEKVMEGSKLPSEKQYKAGWLGGYFAKSMYPGKQMKGMKTFSSMNPLGSQLDHKVVEENIRQQRKTLLLLDRAHAHNLNRLRVPTSLSPFLRLKLGDTFRFFIYHNLRHFEQAERNIL